MPQGQGFFFTNKSGKRVFAAGGSGQGQQSNLFAPPATAIPAAALATAEVAPEKVPHKAFVAAAAQEPDANGLTQSPAFKAWFGDSKIVDEAGKPQVMYRGTSNPNAAAYPGSNNSMIFLSTEGKFAENYARGGKVYPLYVNSRAPFDASRGEGYQLWKQFVKETNAASYASGGTERGALPFWTMEKDLRKWLDDKGIKYDGIWFAENDRSASLAVLKASQIKSATGNRGTFDPKNPDIRMSRAPLIFRMDRGGGGFFFRNRYGKVVHAQPGSGKGKEDQPNPLAAGPAVLGLAGPRKRTGIVRGVGDEAQSARGLGRLTLDTDEAGNIDPHLVEAYRRHLAATGHVLGEFKVNPLTKLATATVTHGGTGAGGAPAAKFPSKAFVQPAAPATPAAAPATGAAAPVNESWDQRVARMNAEADQRVEQRRQQQQPAGGARGAKGSESGGIFRRLPDGRTIFIPGHKVRGAKPAVPQPFHPLDKPSPSPEAPLVEAAKAAKTERAAKLEKMADAAIAHVKAHPAADPSGVAAAVAAQAAARGEDVAHVAPPAPAKPAAAQPKAAEGKGERGPTKAGIERQMLDAWEQHTGASQAEFEDEKALQDFHAPFTFHQKLPGEVKDFLQGRAHLKRLFTTTQDASKAQGADAMEKLGQDRYFAMAERGRASRVGQALEHARNSPDPELKLAASIYDTMEGRGERGKVEHVHPESLKVDEAGTINKIPVHVTIDADGNKILTDGGDLPDTPIDALSKPLPFDKGSRHQGAEPDLPAAKPAAAKVAAPEQPNYEFVNKFTGKMTDAGLQNRREHADFLMKHPLPNVIPGMKVTEAQVRREQAAHRASKAASYQRSREVNAGGTTTGRTVQARQRRTAEILRTNPKLSYRQAWEKSLTMSRGGQGYFFTNKHGQRVFAAGSSQGGLFDPPAAAIPKEALKPQGQSLADFAAHVQKLGNEHPVGLGDNKVYLSHIAAKSGMAPEAFKAKVKEAAHAGLLRVSRADLPLNPAEEAKSEVDLGAGGTAHYLQVEPRARAQIANTMRPTVKAGAAPSDRASRVRQGIAAPHEHTLAEYRERQAAPTGYDKAPAAVKAAIDAGHAKAVREARAGGETIHPDVARDYPDKPRPAIDPQRAALIDRRIAKQYDPAATPFFPFGEKPDTSVQSDLDRVHRAAVERVKARRAQTHMSRFARAPDGRLRFVAA